MVGVWRDDDLERAARRRPAALFDGLKQAAREVGGRQIQNAGTLAGNLCNASRCRRVPPLLHSMSKSTGRPLGTRRLPLAAFITGNRRTALKPAS